MSNIERSLDPQETMLLWLAEARQYPSVLALAQSLKGRPDGAHPLFRLSEQVEAAVRRQLASESSEKVERAVRDAVRDVARSSTCSTSSTSASRRRRGYCGRTCYCSCTQ